MKINILTNQPAQGAFLKDLISNWCLFSGGWGSGKSWAGARKHLVLSLLNKFPSMVIAPTHGDLGRYLIPALFQTAIEWNLPLQNRSEIVQVS